MSNVRDRIPLQMLICDSDAAAARFAEQAFQANSVVTEASVAASIDEAQEKLRANEINTICDRSAGF